MFSHCCCCLKLSQLYFMLSIFYFTFCSTSFSIVEFLKFSFRYVWIFKFRMLTWTKTGQKWYLLILIFVKCWPWATPAAGLSLKLLQQTRLDSLLFSTWFLCWKAAAKHWSYWNNKLTILTDQRFKLISSTDLLCVCTSASAHDLRDWNTDFHEHHGRQMSDCLPSWVQPNVQMWDLNLETWQRCCPELQMCMC